MNEKHLPVPDDAAYDALRAAVDLHVAHGSGAPRERRTELLADAEAFYQWLKGKESEQ